MSDEAPKKSILQPVTDKVRTEVRELIAASSYAALATLEPEGGHPACSRVGLAVLADGTPFVFISALAAHTKALLADPRCSLLVGEPGKGDPLAHPRISITCTAIVMDDENATDARQRYLQAHPKAKLYIDLPDFRFFRLQIERASFNGGFGRAYAFEAADFIKA